MKNRSLFKKQICIGLLWGALILFTFSGCGPFDPLGESGLGLKLYLAGDSNNIFSYDIFRNESQLVYDDGDPFVPRVYTAMAVDSVNKKLYFVDSDTTPAKIYRTNLDGTDKSLFLEISDSITAMAFNPNKTSIFIATITIIKEVDIESKLMNNIPGVFSANSLAWDDVRSVLYYGNGTNIYKAPSSIIYNMGSSITALTIDTAENRLYWLENADAVPNYRGPVYSAPADNCYAKTPLFNIISSCSSVVIDPHSRNIYWTQWDMSGSVLYAKKNNEPPKSLYRFSHSTYIKTIDLWP